MPRKPKCIRDLRFAYLTHEEPHFQGNRRYNGVQARGINYERKAIRVMDEAYAERFLAHPWFFYRDRDDARGRWCQPDGLLILPEKAKIVICEIKLRHVADAYFQLFDLYLPVVKMSFGSEWEFACCEIVRWYDPAEPVPQKAHLCKEVKTASPGEFAVNILKP